MNPNRILISTAELQKIVARLAGHINTAYARTDKVTALVILEGARLFAADLLDNIAFPIQVETLKAASYCGADSSGSILHNGHDGLREKIRKKHILVIDDIYDTGRTLSCLLDWIGGCGPQSIKTCVLLEKEIDHDKDVTIDFLGTKVPDVFVIGYGMDYNGQFRDLPFIAELAFEQMKE